jgi:general secretion pathway protein K
VSARADSGVVLINVLVVLALASSIVYLMLGSQDAALDRIRHSADAAQAEMLAYGAEASVIDALRRDMNTAPEEDHYTEAWAQVNQSEVTLATGRFSVRVTDAQAKFDINRLAGVSLTAEPFLARLLDALDLPSELAPRVAAYLRARGPVSGLGDLADLALPGDVVARLLPYVTALPEGGTINLNTADPLLLRLLFRNPGFAARVASVREREGRITRAMLDGIGAARPENSGFTSDVFDVDILVEVGEAHLRMSSRIVRRSDLETRTVGVAWRRLQPVQDPPPPGGS